MFLHAVEDVEMGSGVEEHSADDFGKNLLSRTCDAGVVEQVTGTVLRVGPEGVGQPACGGCLNESASRLQEFHSVQHSAVLVLPSASGGEQLFEQQGTVADGHLVPSQSAEVAEGSEHRGSEDAACAQSAAGGDGREQRDFDAASELFELFAECG